MKELESKVALVTGASRGVGKGIAEALGEAGATVYVTARSTRGKATTEGLEGTIEETAELVSSLGGRGIPVVCDHTSDDEVMELFARIRREHERLDILVNNVWGGYEGHSMKEFLTPFWEQPLHYWQGMFEAGVRAHYRASRCAAPMMLRQRKGLIIFISAGYKGVYLRNLLYDVSKAAIDRMAYGMAREMEGHHVAVLSLYPGFVRTERVVKAFHDAGEKDLSMTHYPRYTGRAVVALAADPLIMGRSGQVLTTGDLAWEYGFTDIDGRQPGVFVIEDGDGH